MPPVSELEGSQPSTETLETTVSTPAEDTSATGDNTAASPAGDGKEPKSLLDVIKDVVEPAKAEATSAPDTEESAPEGESAPEAELSDEDLSKVPFNKHPDFRRLVRERRTLREYKATAEARIAELEAPAQQYARLEQHLRENNLTDEDFAGVMGLGILLKTDPVKARSELIKVLMDLDRVTGEYLPDDLRNDVETGAMTEDRARELSRARAAERRAQEAMEARSRESEADRAAHTQEAIVSAVDAWEATVRTDPDYSVKKKLVSDRVIAVNARLGMPSSPDEAVKRCKTAYEEVTAELKAALPRKPEMRRPAESVSTVNTTPARPKDLRSAIEAAVAR